jgi:hypothetical protein
MKNALLKEMKKKYPKHQFHLVKNAPIGDGSKTGDIICFVPLDDDSMAIHDPTMNCNMLRRVDPEEEYGIKKADAKRLVAHNRCPKVKPRR